MAATNNNNGEGQVFGDIDKHQEKQGIYNRLRAALETLQKVLAKDTAFVRACQGFIPHLRRTDKDCGSLPLYSTTYTSKKTNKNHCLLCVISKAVQDYWDFADGSSFDTARLDKLFIQLELLEDIAKNGFDHYRVAGAFPTFCLKTVTEIDALQELAELKHDDLEDDEQRIAETETQEQIEANEGEADAKGGADENFTKDSSTVEEKSGSENVDQDSSGDSDQLSPELADKCGGDCDTCKDKVCETAEASGVPDVPEEEDHEEELMTSDDQRDEEERQQQQNDDGEQYPDQGPVIEEDEPDHTDEEIEDAGPQ